MAESVVNFALETIGSMLIEEAKFLHGVKDQVEQLQLELDRMQSFLRDAEARQHEEGNLTVWISQTRDLVYEAGDLLERYAFNAASYQKKNIFKRSISIFNECYLNHSIGSEIQRLQSKISRLTKGFLDYGIRAIMEREDSSSSSEQQLRRTYSHIVQDDFIGLDSDVEMLVGHLVNENEADCHGVVSILGMGGLGKTTLARKVYNHPKVQRYFENRAWVCVSQPWQKRKILQGILIKFFKLERDEIMKWEDEELIRKLFETVQNKRCLVVLDDIWSTDPWEGIKEAFPVAKKGSKLLLTTRGREVALHIGPNGFHHQPRFLSDLESWELLQMKALKERTYQCLEEMHKMEELGKEMVKHCAGLPLAVVVLAGILVLKRNLNEWEGILENVEVYIGREAKFRNILELSYNDLPLKLKPCFLYLGRYPEDSKIDVEKLYQLWIAEGMILAKDQIGEESMMDVAESYLAELVERSMVQVKVNEDILRVTKFESCCLHDLMRKLCMKKAEEENFFLFVRSRDGLDDGQVYKSSSLTHQIHRFVIHFQQEDVPKYVPPRKEITRHLRSLKLFVESGDGHYVGRMPRTIKSQLSGFRMLRVLEMEGLTPRNVPDGFKESFCCILSHLKLPVVVGNLIHLRYFSLRKSCFLWLPSSIGNLRHLQTIDLRILCGIRIPNVLWKMRQLRHLYLPDFEEFFLFDNVVKNKLQFDGLNKLEILEGFNNKWCSSEDLLKLTNLRWLKANLLVEYDDIIETIAIMSKIDHITIDARFPRDNSLTREKCSTVVSKLFSCRNLNELTMFYQISELPKYEASFGVALTSLLLSDSMMKDDPMETLERLPNLRLLRLDKKSFIGTEMQCHATGFPQLRQIRLFGLPNLDKWSIDEGAMPNLSGLVLWSSKKLKMIPDGLRFIEPLQHLQIIGMPEEFNRRLQVIDGQEGEDFDKIRHVPSVLMIDDPLKKYISSVEPEESC